MSLRSIQRVLGALWLLDAALQAQPVNFGSHWWRADVAGAAMGEPAPVAHLILWTTAFVSAHAAIWNVAFVSVQALLGLALITGRHVKEAVVMSIPWSLGVWVIGEGLGMLPTGFAMLAFGAPGAVLLYPLVGLLAWPGRSSPRAATASWVVLWAGLSLLQLPLVFPARQVVSANLQETAGLWPSAGPAGALSIGLAAVQVAVGLGVLSARLRRPALAAGLVVSAFYWVCFQGAGGLFAGGATDPGTAPLMVLLALVMWPLAAGRSDHRRDVSRPGRPLSEELSALAVA